jgi:hypothetical protein
MRFASGSRNHSGLIGEQPPIVCSRGVVVTILVIFQSGLRTPFTNRLNSVFAPFLSKNRPKSGNLSRLFGAKVVALTQKLGRLNSPLGFKCATPGAKWQILAEKKLPEVRYRF